MTTALEEVSNPPYITVLHGVNVYVVVRMEYNNSADEYRIIRQSPALKTKEGANVLARTWAFEQGIELR